MLISVVIPVHNRRKPLQEAVTSVLQQSHNHLELIIVDDGSTDKGAEDVVRYFRDSRIRILRQGQRGVAAARNAGIAEARGEMISLLDSDDLWETDKLARQLSFMQSSGLQVSQTEEVWIRNGVRLHPGRRHRKRAGWIFEPSLRLCLVSPSCVMFSSTFWERVGPFDPGLTACEDYDLWLRASLFYPFGLLPEALVRKQGGHPDQLSRKIIGLDLYRIYSLLGILQRERLNLRQEKQVRDQLAERIFRYARGCLKRDKPEEAKRVINLGKKCGVHL